MMPTIMPVKSEPEVLAAGGVAADPLADGDEADFDSGEKYRETDDDEDTTDGEIEEVSIRKGGDKEVQQSDEGDDRAD